MTFSIKRCQSNISIDFSKCLIHSLTSNLCKVNYHVAYLLALIYILANPIGTAKSNFCQILPINLCKIEFILFSSCSGLSGLLHKSADKTAIRIISSRCGNLSMSPFDRRRQVQSRENCQLMWSCGPCACGCCGLMGSDRGWYGVVCCGLM